MKMKTTTLPTPQRNNPHARKPITVTMHPWILAQIDQRNGNRSEQVNCDLARLYLIEAGKEEMTPAERRRFKALASTRTIHEEPDANCEKQPTPTPTPSSPELKSPTVPTPSETDPEFESLNVERPLTLLENHPAKSPALTLGLVLKLAKHYASRRDRHEVAQG